SNVPHSTILLFVIVFGEKSLIATLPKYFMNYGYVGPDLINDSAILAWNSIILARDSTTLHWNSTILVPDSTTCSRNSTILAWISTTLARNSTILAPNSTTFTWN